MAISSITTSRSYLTKQVTSLNRTLQEKTAQLATGKQGTTYGSVGNNRLMDLQLTQRVRLIESFETTITRANLHLETLNLTLDRLEDIRLESKAAIDQNNFQLQTDGQTTSQATSEILLYEAVNILNENISGHYLYGGSDAVSDPVAAVDAILDGTATRAGLRTVMEEFYKANLGVNNNGRMDVSTVTTNYTAGVPTDSTFTIAEDGAHDFGFDIGTVTSTLSNTTITGPSGTDPDTFDIQFTDQPVLGESITIELTLPPDHSEPLTLSLEAVSEGSADGTFVIGADIDETANNLRDKINEFLEEQAKTTLRAASDTWAGDSFFDTYGGGEPMRVDGPPYETATALTGGAATTVNWYTGENSATTDARDDKDAIIDNDLTVKYGVRANEEGLSDLIKSLAVFVAADFSDGDAAAEQYHTELADDMWSILAPADVDESGIANISTEIAIAYKTVQDTADRHVQTKSTYQTTIDEIEGVDKELLAAEILQLQTNIEASYRASSIVYNLTLADYI